MNTQCSWIMGSREGGREEGGKEEGREGGREGGRGEVSESGRERWMEELDLCRARSTEASLQRVGPPVRRQWQRQRAPPMGGASAGQLPRWRCS